jgi:hypothetical protein
LRNIAAFWAVSAVVLCLWWAVYRLGLYAWQMFDMPLTPLQWLLLGLNIVFMAYSEGYKGFQKSFSPRFAARVLYIKQQGTALEMLLAPFFCFGYFGANKKRLITTYILSGMIVCLVFIVRHLPQPWRGIVDAGVVVGLLWGSISLIIFVYRAMTDKDYPHSAELTGA